MSRWLLLGLCTLSLLACERAQQAGKRVPIPLPPHGISDVLAEDQAPRQRPNEASPTPNREKNTGSRRENKQPYATAPQATPTTQAKDAAPQAAPLNPSSPPSQPSLGVAGIRWQTPVGWQIEARKSPMRLATYLLPLQASCAIFYFGRGQGGSIDANLKRWAGQFSASSPDAAPPKPLIQKRQHNGLSFHTIQIQGRYSESMRPMAQRAPQPSSEKSMWGMIVEAPAGPVFFKCVGDHNAIRTAQPALEALLLSVQRTPSR